MGLFSKIKELFTGSKTKRLNEGNYYESKYGAPQNKELKLPFVIGLPDKKSIMITSLEYNNIATHSNGEKTDVIVAKMIEVQEDSVIAPNSETHIAFEVTQGVPIDQAMLSKIGTYYLRELKNKDRNPDCMYLGRISENPYGEINWNNKSDVIGKYINEKVAPRLNEEKRKKQEKQIIEQRAAEVRDISEHEEYVRKLQNEQREKQTQQNNVKMDRINNPYLKQVGPNYVVDGKIYSDYNGIDMIGGDILKLRKLNKVGKDANNIYLYTGYISTTPNEYDSEVLSKTARPMGRAVCFASDRKIEEILQSNDIGDLKTLLTALSLPSNEKNEALEYIGRINRSNMIDTDLNNATEPIKSTVAKLKEEFREEQERKSQQRGSR